MKFTRHARKKMTCRSISKKQVEECLKYGEPYARYWVNGELRYAQYHHATDLIVVYVWEKDEQKVITAYHLTKGKLAKKRKR